MKYDRILWTTVLLFCVVTLASAQLTLTASSFPGPGFTYTSHQMHSEASFDVGSAGANQTWTFDNYEWEATETSEVLAPGDTPYGELFPAATRVSHIQNDPTYLYELITSNGYYVLGVASTDETMLYDPAWMIATLPATYGTEWSSTMSIEEELQPGMVMRMLDSTAYVIDGWGTCNTPFGSHQVLRVFAHHWMITSLNGVEMYSAEFLSYAWLNSQGISVVNVDSDDEVTDPDFNAGIIEMNTTSVAVGPAREVMPQSFTVGQNYPNPFNPTTSLPVQLKQAARVTIEVFDETGRTVTTRTLDLTAGNHDIPMNGGDWSTGSYFARVSTGDEAVTRRMLLVK